MQWKDVPIYVIDFEGSLNSGIVEYGVVSIRNGEISDADGSLCRATGEITGQDYGQHGISRSDTESFPTFAEHWDKFSSFRKSGVLCAHYAHVENGLIKSVWPHPGQCPDFAQGGMMAEWGPWIDTCRLYMNADVQLDSYKLSDLLKHFKLEDKLTDLAERYCPDTRSKWHCALYDALASALLLCHFCSEQDEPSIKELLLMSTSNSESREKMIQDELF